MNRKSPKTRSLVSRLLLAQGLPLAAFACALLAIGAWTAHSVVERTADRLLAGALQSIRESVTIRDGEVAADVSPWSLALLDGPERDAVFYSIRDGGTLVTGYADLPTLSSTHALEPAFADIVVRGVKVRMAQQSVSIPGRDRPIIVSIAQSLDSRSASQFELYRSLLLLPALLVALAGLLIWPAVNWGLRSLNRLVDDLSDRSAAPAASYGPLPVEFAPQELSPVIAAFNRLLSGLERSRASVERFSADASHQLRTPLSILAANLDLLERSERGWTPTERRLVADSRQAVSDMSRLTQQLLATARADAQQSRGSAELRRAVRHGALQAAEGKDGLCLRLPPEDIFVVGDEALIREQLNNLVDNAFKYGAPPVFIHVTRKEKDAVVTVWDHGEGVAVNGLGHLTERFYRASSDTSGGSGLGLAIVETLAQTQGGSLELQNRRRRSGLIATLQFSLAEPPEGSGGLSVQR